MWKFLCNCPPIPTHDKIYIICLIKFKKLKILKTHILAQHNKIKYGNYHFKEIKCKKEKKNLECAMKEEAIDFELTHAKKMQGGNY